MWSAGPAGLVNTVATFEDAFPISNLIREAKYRGEAGASRLLGRLISDSVSLLQPKPELLVPIPMPWPRLLWRGHDHAVELAQSVANASGVRLGLQVLARRGWQAPQASLPRDKRARNLIDAFVVREVPPVSAVALVDDLSTTGATLTAAAAALSRAGFETVHAIVIARHL